MKLISNFSFQLSGFDQLAVCIFKFVLNFSQPPKLNLC